MPQSPRHTSHLCRQVPTPDFPRPSETDRVSPPTDHHWSKKKKKKKSREEDRAWSPSTLGVSRETPALAGEWWSWPGLTGLWILCQRSSGMAGVPSSA